VERTHSSLHHPGPLSRVTQFSSGQQRGSLTLGQRRAIPRATAQSNMQRYPLLGDRKLTHARIWSVMIEVNRGIYMNEHSGLANQEFERVRAVIGHLIVTAAEAVMSDLRSG
jgi:hypothetical protein